MAKYPPGTISIPIPEVYQTKEEVYVSKWISYLLSKEEGKVSFRDFIGVAEGTNFNDWPDEFLVYALSILKKRPNDLVGERDQLIMKKFREFKTFVIKNHEEIVRRATLAKLRK